MSCLFQDLSVIGVTSVAYVSCFLENVDIIAMIYTFVITPSLPT